MKKRIATIGFFDGVHRGHRFLIDQLCTLATERELDSLIVTFDRHPRQVICTDYVPELLSTYEEKDALLKQTPVNEIEFLHFTKEMSRFTASDFMQQVLCKKLNVQVLLMGYDHRFGHNGGTPDDYIRWGREFGMEVLMAQELPDGKVSSSRIRNLLKEGELETANALLGRSYTLDGMVVEGHKVGRTMGFPTANLQLNPEKLLPAKGVYAVRCTTADGDHLNGVLNIGNRPTIGNGDDISVEVHLLHYTGDLYGQQVQLELEKRIRCEMEFASKEELRQQIEEDISTAQKILLCL